MEKLKVVMLVGDFPPSISGVGDYTACLSRFLASNGVNVNVATTQFSGLCNREISGNIEIRRFIRGWFFSDVRSIIALIDEMGPGTIVHIQYHCPATYGRKPMINLIPGIIRVKRPHNPVVVTIHEFNEQRFRWRARVTPMILATNAAILVKSSDYQIVKRWFKPFKLRTVHIPIASSIKVVPINETTRDTIRDQLGFDRKDVVITFFGGMRPDKGFMDLISALYTIRAKGTFVRLLVIGGFGYPLEAFSPYALKVREVLEHPEVKNWATIVPAQEPEMVSRLLQLADLAVFPFTIGASENRSSLLAAIAHGLPVITTRGASTPDRFNQDYGVETVPAGDLNALVSHISALVHSPEAREKLSRKAIAAGCRFSWNEIALNTISLYLSLIGCKVGIHEKNSR